MLIVKRNTPVRPSRRVLLLGALLSAYTLLMLAVGAELQREQVLARVIRPWISGNAAALANYCKGLMTNPKQLRLDISFSHLQSLREQRDKALSIGLLFAGNDDFVPATVSLADKTAKASIRLKGDAVDHLASDKWSFRVEIKGEDTLQGMKQFSLQHPAARNYIFEWLYHRAMRRDGIVALRYDFLEVVLNGKSLGVYALEEHFEKRLLEHNGRREGEIVRFEEEPMWRMIEQSRRFPEGRQGESGSYLSSKIDAFQSSRILATEAATQHYANTVQLLEAFRRGTLQTSDVFDVDLLARYFAIADLMGAEHGSRWHNIRIYCNPVTKRLEPIAFDGSGGLAISRLIGDDWQEVHTAADGRGHLSFRGRLFADSALRQSYLRALERVSSQEYLSDLLAREAEDMNAALAVLYREWPHAPMCNLDVLRRNQEYIRSVLSPPTLLDAGFRSADGTQVVIEVGNLQGLEVEVTGLVLPGRQGHIAPRTPAVLDGKQRGRIVEYRAVEFDLPVDLPWDRSVALSTQVAHRIHGTQDQRLVPLTPFSVVGSDDPRHRLLQQSPNIHRFDFALVDQRQSRITIRPGQWSVRQSIIVPAGYTLSMEPGTTIDLLERALLLSYSPLEWHGSPDRPITIMSSDRTGQGLVVLEAKDTSSLSHVRFEQLRHPDAGGWSLTGSVTFYKSPLVANNCVFVANLSEDGLNLIHTTFSLRQCRFADSASDAFDADFCNGTIDDTRFEQIANDAIDVSGSKVVLRHITVDSSGDKAISSGEASHVVAEDLDIRNAKVGLASKDQSQLTVTGARLEHCTYAVAAFQKKPEFGPATMTATHLTIVAAKELPLVQLGSEVIVNGQRVDVRELDIDNILYATAKPTGF